MSTFKAVSKNVADRKIAILTGASLSWNPRAFKEARALARAGFNVVVYGGAIQLSGLASDEAIARQHGFVFKSVIAMSQSSPVRSVKLAWWRLRSKFGRKLFRFIGVEGGWQLGPLIPALLREARNANADYYIVHHEQAAWVGVSLLSAGFRVGVDMEDWYSADLLPEARKYRPIRLLRDLERKLLIKGGHATCPSQAMSQALVKEYGCPPPTVIYNAFAWSERNSLDCLLKDRTDRRIPSIHWFSQTLGHGRGLEDLFCALPFVQHEAEIHLRGNPVPGFEGWLSNRVPEGWRDRVFIHGLVPNEELLSRIAEHDIGFAGEMKFCRNRDLTITNKILQYLLAGLAVVASDTAGQHEVADQAPAAVFLYPSGDASALAACLNELLNSPERLKRTKAGALRAAEQIFCWERQEISLLETVARALGERTKNYQTQ